MTNASSDFGIVVIGRNEGERLRHCLSSLPKDVPCIYVDSGSTDSSVQLAKSMGVDVVELDRARPFTAARGRNEGFARICTSYPDLRFVQFLDGDCELLDGWTTLAARFLTEHPKVAAVCGTLIERYPESSVYNWLCSKEWNGPDGEIAACAGNAMFRADAFSQAHGFRADVIAAEEDELCVRLRAEGWSIWRMPAPMATHDAGMLHFCQWWKRAKRAGYAFTQGAYLHGWASERHFVWQAARTFLWGIALPATALLGLLLIGPVGLIPLLAYPVQFLRNAMRGGTPLSERLTLAAFQAMARFPEAQGQISFLVDLIRAKPRSAIEHK